MSAAASAAIAVMLIEGNRDYDRGVQDALDGVDRVGPSMFTLRSRYDEGYDEGEREKEQDA